MNTSEQEAHWVLRAQCDDREAMELLLGSVQAALRRYVSGLVGSGDADDILQNTLVLIYRKLAWLEDPALFRPWAFRIASRTAFRWLKQKKRQTEERADEIALDGIAEAGQLTSELLQELGVIEGISPASRAVLVLHFQEDLPLSEVAAILEIPVGTVKSRLAYGLAVLRQHVKCMRRT
ncbi:MAG TPA: sigma-70 family RNA polymerase sigma factor [Terriglobia bacterium]|jgi:RNA polymerase sigma-70 factor (ECF subfamily)|nr:sigma-70 family RNA polymerase sigma factor [Terriglobia bacterium]